MFVETDQSVLPHLCLALDRRWKLRSGKEYPKRVTVYPRQMQDLRTESRRKRGTAQSSNRRQADECVKEYTMVWEKFII